MFGFNYLDVIKGVEPHDWSSNSTHGWVRGCMGWIHTLGFPWLNTTVQILAPNLFCIVEDVLSIFMYVKGWDLRCSQREIWLSWSTGTKHELIPCGLFALCGFGISYSHKRFTPIFTDGTICTRTKAHKTAVGQHMNKTLQSRMCCHELWDGAIIYGLTIVNTTFKVIR